MNKVTKISKTLNEAFGDKSQDVRVIMPKAFLAKISKELSISNKAIAEEVAKNNTKEELKTIIADNKELRNLMSNLENAIYESRVDKVEVLNLPKQKDIKIPNYPKEIAVKKPSWFKEYSDKGLKTLIKGGFEYLAKELNFDKYTKKENALAVRLVDKTGKSFYDAMFQAISGGFNSSIFSNGTQKTQIVDASGNDVNRLFNQDNYLSEFLLNGASEDMAVDGSTPVEFFYTVPVGKKAKLTRGFITIEDGASEFIPSNFGAISGALANGVEISITPSGGAKVVLETWTTNREVRATMFDFDNQFKVAGAYVGRWTFGKDIGDSGFSLNAGDKFSFLIQDNIAALTFMSFSLKGVIENA